MDTAAPEFSTLFESHAPALRRSILKSCHDPHVADELVAETFARAWELRDRFEDRGPGSREAWLHGIAANVASRWHRDRRVERRGAERLASHDEHSSPDLAEEVIDRAAAATVGSRLREAFAGLTREQRDALSMRVLDDASYEEIASATGSSLPTARARVSRGLRTLAVMSGIAAAILLTLAVASGAASDLVERIWPAEQQIVIPSLREIESSWDDVRVDIAPTAPGAATTAPGEAIQGDILPMPVGAPAVPISGGAARVLHPSVGEYVLVIPLEDPSVADVVPSTDVHPWNRVTGTALDVPDPQTGARIAVPMGSSYSIVGSGAARSFHMPIQLRAFAPMSEAGMECVRKGYRSSPVNPTDAAAIRGALSRALEGCRMVPTVMPEIDIEATKRFGDGADVLDQDPGTPIDLEGDMAITVSVSLLEIRGLAGAQDHPADAAGGGQ